MLLKFERRSRNKTGKEKEGFAFLELMITLLITGIVLGITVPAIQRPLDRFMVITSARQLVSDIRDLQQEAVSLEDNGFNILFSTGFYRIRRDNQTIKKIDLPKNVTIAYNNFPMNQLNLNLKGLPLNNGHVKFYSETTGETRYVIVYALTGRVRLNALPPS